VALRGADKTCVIGCAPRIAVSKDGVASVAKVPAIDGLAQWIAMRGSSPPMTTRDKK
jgi:hypothetical protein